LNKRSAIQNVPTQKGFARLFFGILATMFSVEISKQFRATQGLPSPVREGQGLPGLVPEDGFTVVLRVGIAFADDQLTDKGWFVDTDAIDDKLVDCCTYLGSNTWTAIFNFRPTFELVTRWAYNMLEGDIPGLQYVALDNKTIGVSTRYTTQ
jgi:6-pyruvoyltetrahydropterin/6-carboxytetrahydropterin synthase